jgi:hypothetical protein
MQNPQPDQAELVEALSFFTSSEERQPVDNLSVSGRL